MFVHTVCHRTRSINSRPLSSATILDGRFERPTSMVRTSSPVSSQSSSSSASIHDTRRFTLHENDSDATIGNDILILQLAKEDKLEFAQAYSEHPANRSYLVPPAPSTSLSLHANMSTTTLAPPGLLPPSAYLDVASQNPWDEASSGPIMGHSGSPIKSPTDPLSSGASASSSVRQAVSAWSASPSSAKGKGGASTTRDLPRGRYSTRPLVESGRTSHVGLRV